MFTRAYIGHILIIYGTYIEYIWYIYLFNISPTPYTVNICLKCYMYRSCIVHILAIYSSTICTIYSIYVPYMINIWPIYIY